MVQEITDSNFEEILFNNSRPVIIDFWARWCGPCKSVTAAIELMAQEYDGQVIIGKVDVDTNPRLTSKFGVRNMPTILYLKEGEVMGKQVGSASKSVLEEKLKAIL